MDKTVCDVCGEFLVDGECLGCKDCYRRASLILENAQAGRRKKAQDHKIYVQEVKVYMKG